MVAVAPVGAVSVWIRRESAEPSVYSVRFEVARGQAALRLPPAWGPPASPAAAGSVSGLRYGDLQRCTLVIEPEGARAAVAVPVLRGLAVDPRSLGTGRWVRCVSPVLEPIPVSSRTPPDPELDNTDVGVGPVLVEAEEERTDLGLPPELPPSEELDTGRLMSARPAPTLVRSLMRRIREQEAEIKSLKARLALLERSG